ncbi:hypothetical protein CC86DRAFT_367352 [Ophiobolus disseminans]|uniref:Uncharacterized protein n=1 Tax=Ophiobolus disseminans TaxID=1469910 RepID=A0A6A7AD31_9PLEO|nr:hypothetical protein CC86DRAFT_367352 [Ophiobolus disseminans]
MREVQIELTKNGGTRASSYDHISIQLLKIFHGAKSGKVDVPTASIFAADILLDIRSVCNQKRDSWVADLSDTATVVTNSLDRIMKTCERVHPNEYFSEYRLRDKCNWIADSNVPWKRLMYLEEFASHPIWESLISEPLGIPRADEIQEELRRVSKDIPYHERNRDCVPPTIDGYFLRRTNPLLCARLKLELLLDFQDLDSASLMYTATSMS